MGIVNAMKHASRTSELPLLVFMSRRSNRLLDVPIMSMVQNILYRSESAFEFLQHVDVHFRRPNINGAFAATVLGLSIQDLCV